MATLLELETAITDISKNHYIQTDSDVSLASRINEAVSSITGGIRMPDSTISPPMPELLEITTVATTANAYADLPATYERKLFYVANSSGDRIFPSKGGDYYSFTLFLNSVENKGLTKSGSVTNVCVKGNKIYYQGIPSASEDITVMFYRKAVVMALATDTPDGIPGHLQTRLIKHYVGMQLANEMVDGIPEKARYHENEFFKAMSDLIVFVGEETEPSYYNSGYDHIDRGVCD